MKQMIFILLLFLFIIGPSYAQSYNMIVTKTGGAQEIISISNINEIVFEGLVSVKDYEKFAEALSTFQILQNYPNPFNPITTIEYNIPSPGMVKVQIFDINGCLINVIEQGEKSEGIHKTVWNGKDSFGNPVASGAYIYSVTYNNSNISKKLLLIK